MLIYMFQKCKCGFQITDSRDKLRWYDCRMYDISYITKENNLKLQSKQKKTNFHDAIDKNYEFRKQLI